MKKSLRIYIPDNILSRIEFYKEQKIIILYNVDSGEILRGNEDMLNLFCAIEKNPNLDKIIKELANLYNPEILISFKETIIDSIDSLCQKAFLYSSEVL